jgi:ankyrin repeat protein
VQGERRPKLSGPWITISRMSELTDAIKAGDLTRVSALVAADPGLLGAAENGVTPVMLAIYHGKKDVAQLLVERGAPLSFGEACALGDAERVKTMLAADPQLLNSRTPDGYPPMPMAIFFGHGELARWLIAQGADVNAYAENANRVAPVHAAAAACDRETMRLLLEKGADPNARQVLDYTPLHGAGSRGDVEMAKLLLANGAQRDPRGADGKSVADVAREHSQSAFAEWIERSS